MPRVCSWLVVLALVPRVAAFQTLHRRPLRRGDAIAAVDKPIAAVDEALPGDYQRGLITVGSITVVFASNSPVLHAAATGAAAPPVLLLNACCAALALAGLLGAGPLLAPLAPTRAAPTRRSRSAAAWNWVCGNSSARRRTSTASR